MLSRAAVWIGLISAALVSASAVAASDDQTRKDEAFSRAASAIVDRVEREDGFSGVILVARGDHVLLRKAAGFADRERGIRNTPDTIFWLESVGKQFTATAIMLLVQDRRVSLDDLASKYYPASPSAWNSVTVKHLLTHSSGIEDYWIRRPDDLSARDTGAAFESFHGLIKLAVVNPLAFEPGSGFEYSNTGYALLSATIERASGHNYCDFMRQRILAPLGMRHTFCGAVPADVDVVQAYTRTSDGWTRQPSPKPEIFGGAGSISSTVDDLLIWSSAQENSRLLSAASQAAMFADYGYNYGFGVRFAPKFGRKLIWHTGNDNRGHATIFDRFPDEGLTVIAMTNSDGPTNSTATLLVEGKAQTFPANAMRKAVEQVERLYFGREP